MFPFSGVELIFVALAISIVIKPITRAATDIARARHERNAKAPVDTESQERIEALEERLRLLEERQDFTDKLLLGRKEARIEGSVAAPPPGDNPPPQA